MAEFYLKLAELQAYAPEEARAMIESHERDVRARQEADKQAKAKGANIGIKKEIEGLNVYLQHFIDQLEAKEKNE